MNKILLIIPVLALIASCSDDGDSSSTVSSDQETKEMIHKETLPKNDTLLAIEYNGFPFEVQIKVPDGNRIGTMLVLQGWNFPITDWCDSTSLCEKALDQGYVLVFPDMAKSIYSEKVYPQTREDWKLHPTREWLREDVVKFLQKEMNLFDPKASNHVLGLSTGGRGALFMALELPNVFDACAALSGDYDQYMFPNDNLYIGYFGPMKQNQKVWQSVENPTRIIGALQIPLYVGHGLQDNVVPYRHMELLKEHIEYYKLKTNVVYHTDSTASHNYTYWESEVDNVLDFFKNAKVK